MAYVDYYIAQLPYAERHTVADQLDALFGKSASLGSTVEGATQVIVRIHVPQERLGGITPEKARGCATKVLP